MNRTPLAPSFSSCCRRLLACLLLASLCSNFAPAAVAQVKQLSPQAMDAAKLLNVQPLVDQLFALRSNSARAGSDEELRVEVLLVRKILAGALEVRKATDTIDNELGAEYTAQQQMIANRDRGIEVNNTINFMQNGTLGLVSGYLNLQQTRIATITANEIDLISGGTVIALTSLSQLQGRGGKRKSPTEPNMLGQVLSVNVPAEYRFSPLMLTYLNAVPPDSKDGLTRKEQLLARWKKAGVLTINLNKEANLQKLTASGPSHKQRSETIKLIQNRIVMLHDVHTLVESLDSELIALLHAVD